MFEEIFKRKRLLPDRLPLYGFRNDGEAWLYETDILNREFALSVCIAESGAVDTKVVEKETGEEYVLYKTGSVGTYVGEVRAAIEEVLHAIAGACFETAVFKTGQAQRIIEYVRAVYGDELEFLWAKTPDNAIWRRKDNEKWYGVILTIPKNRLGFASDERIEIIDLRIQPERMEELLAQEHYYPGWHMNKKHWFTVILDDGVTDQELCRRIDESYALAGRTK